MKASKILVLTMSVGASVFLYACGSSNTPSSATTTTTPTQPSQPTGTSLYPTDVQAQAKMQSETSDPYVVNGGAVTVRPIDDETDDPMSVD